MPPPPKPGFTWVWDVDHWKLVPIPPPPGPTPTDLSPVTAQTTYVSPDGTVHLIEVSQGEGGTKWRVKGTTAWADDPRVFYASLGANFAPPAPASPNAPVPKPTAPAVPPPPSVASSAPTPVYQGNVPPPATRPVPGQKPSPWSRAARPGKDVAGGKRPRFSWNPWQGKY